LEAAGNWPPIIALIRALTQCGHHVRVVANANQAQEIEAAGAVYEAYRHAPQRDSSERPPDMTDEMLRVLNNVFFNPIYADELLAAVARERPDVLLVDQMLIMAWIAAESTALPTALLWHTVFGGAARMMNMGNMFIDPMNAVRTRVGLAPIVFHMMGECACPQIAVETLRPFNHRLCLRFRSHVPPRLTPATRSRRAGNWFTTTALQHPCSCATSTSSLSSNL
jgi:hypothetical protein